ncbi:MAG: S-layer homology domain-containing protein, partial [Bacillota bacterium]|nr:S-layer homology domain-containing protein [Bacillota bacterium]
GTQKYTQDATYTAQYTAIEDIVTGGDKPSGYVTVTFDKGLQGEFAEGAETTYYVNPEKEVDLTSKAPTVTANTGWKHTGWDQNLGTQKYTQDATYTAQYTAIASNLPVIPYIPSDSTNPTNENDNNLPKKDENGNSVDLSDYTRVAFTVSPSGSGLLTLDNVSGQEVISALVKNGTLWSNIKMPITEGMNNNAFWYWNTIDDKSVKNGDVRIAKFVKDGDDITNDNTPLPTGFFSVSIVKGNGISDNNLFSKTYAVKANSTLSALKFPELTSENGYKDPKWNVENPWSQNITGDVKFIASAVSSNFDSSSIKSWSINTQPSKLTYSEGETLDLTGLVITLIDNNGNEQDITVDDFVTYGISSAPGNGTSLSISNTSNPIVISKVGLRDIVTDNITVSESTTQPFDSEQIADIEFVKDPTKMVYTEGENPTLDGLQINLTDNNGNSVTIGKNQLTEYGVTIDPFEATVLGLDDNGRYFVASVQGLDANGITRILTANSSSPITVIEKPVDPIIPPEPEPEPLPPYIWEWILTPSEEFVEPEVDDIPEGTHFAYLKGYPDGTIRPDGFVTRAESAQIIATLRGLNLNNSSQPGFADTPSSWYNAAINAVVEEGLMKGYPDGSFRPNERITRAEFAQVIKNIDKASYADAPFADADGHWAEDAINQAYGNGRISGYPDGTFKPDANITRAEAVVICNNLFDRETDGKSLIEKLDNPDDLNNFTDLYASHWAFFELIEASNTHDYQRREKGEVIENWMEIQD